MSDSFDPMDCSPPGSSVLGIFQARILKRAAISSSRGSSQPSIEPEAPLSPALQVDYLPTKPCLSNNCEVLGKVPSIKE